MLPRGSAGPASAFARFCSNGGVAVKLKPTLPSTNPYHPPLLTCIPTKPPQLALLRRYSTLSSTLPLSAGSGCIHFFIALSVLLACYRRGLVSLAVANPHRASTSLSPSIEASTTSTHSTPPILPPQAQLQLLSEHPRVPSPIQSLRGRGVDCLLRSEARSSVNSHHTTQHSYPIESVTQFSLPLSLRFIILSFKYYSQQAAAYA